MPTVQARLQGIAACSGLTAGSRVSENEVQTPSSTIWRSTAISLRPKEHGPHCYGQWSSLSVRLRPGARREGEAHPGRYPVADRETARQDRHPANCLGAKDHRGSCLPG